MADLAGWTQGYAQTVVRTNTTSAFAAGRFREAEDMKREGVEVVALKFVAIEDSRVRPNHLACDGLIASVDDPIWNKLSPPLFYGCRCTVVPVDAIDIPPHLFRADGTLKPATTPMGAYAERGPHGEDLGFGRRPDRKSIVSGGRF